MIISRIEENLILTEKILADKAILSTIINISIIMTQSLNSGKKIWFCGNGGSAAEAQHLAAELSGKFKIDRAALPVEAMHVNTSYITAVANDYGYKHIYERIILGTGQPEDILFILSTSGKSENLVMAAKAARKKHLITISFLGKTPNEIKKLSDYSVSIPSMDTPRIQELHLLLGHIICELVEKSIFGKN
jgi:D-sedoheptulose 7-phosphate isomerase